MSYLERIAEMTLFEVETKLDWLENLPAETQKNRFVVVIRSELKKRIRVLIDNQ